MSYPQTDSVITALLADANPENISEAVILLRQYQTLCTTLEKDFISAKTSKENAEKECNDAKIARDNALVDLDAERNTATKNAVEAQRIYNEAITSKQSELDAVTQELETLKLHPALVAADSEAKAAKIEALKKELLGLDPNALDVKG